jgi:putative transposase
MKLFWDFFTPKILLLLRIECFVFSGGEKPPLEEKMATNTNWEVVNDLQQNAAQIDCKEHFSLGENAQVEIAKVRKTKHSVYNINYHLVWIPKTRMKVLTSPFSETVKETISRVCAYNDWVPMALQVMPDHVHMFISAPPKYAPAHVVQALKAWTSRDLRVKFAIIRKTRFSDDFWASSYYCGTAGHVSAEVVARYIRENSSRF